MLSLRNIVKNYGQGENTVAALKGVSVDFRRNEFVSILGPSGCGKTTLLNIIGGLDRYTSGDLIIEGRSTKNYNDKDWDAYRNNSIGFVFQSYNLIPHQSVLANVELALTISGITGAERRERARSVLEKVGLSDQLHKKPNQLSGGQMQRVAIARALVNNPEIILADEPTGALDTETSIQVLEILKEVAKDKLVIMVTHNPELAERYSTRIIRLLDGELAGDTMPYKAVEEPGSKNIRKPRMGYRTAFALSVVDCAAWLCCETSPNPPVAPRSEIAARRLSRDAADRFGGGWLASNEGGAHFFVSADYWQNCANVVAVFPDSNVAVAFFARSSDAQKASKACADSLSEFISILTNRK